MFLSTFSANIFAADNYQSEISSNCKDRNTPVQSHRIVKEFKFSDKDYQTIENGRVRIRTLKSTAPQQGEHTVKINMKYTLDDMNMAMPQLGYFTESEFKAINVDPNATSVSVNIPSGVYDFIFSISDLGTNYPIYIVKEKVEIDKDTELNFDIAEATERVRIETYSPKGELFQLPTVDFLTGETVSDGNCKMMSINNYLTNSKLNITPIVYGNYPSEYETSGKMEQKISGQWDFYTNKLSDRYSVSTVRVVQDNDGHYNIIRLSNSGAESKTIKNSADSYSWSASDDFKLTPLSKDAKLGTKSGFSWFVYDTDGNLKASELGYVGFDMPESGFPKYRISSTDQNFSIAVRPIISDYQKEIVETFGDQTFTRYEFGTIEGNTIMLENGNISYKKNAYSGSNRYGFDYKDGNRLVPFFGNPEFSFTKEEKGDIYCNSCPINVFEALSLNQNGQKTLGLTPYSCLYVGRLGETRQTDAYAVKMSVKYNGKEIATDYLGLNEFVPIWDSESHEDGEFDLTFTNANVDVDGLQGKNVTHITYDQRKDDWIAPTLQMLQFRNAKSNVVTDRFESPADGVMEFAAGDFEIQNPDLFFKQYYTCKDVDVEVAFSAYNANEWNAMTVEEIPSLFYMPGFGHFYRSTLSGITTDGWYDLKISLTDKAGNKQEQVISPAFKIDRKGGVSDLNSSDSNIYVSDGMLHLGNQMKQIVVYNMAGSAVMEDSYTESVMDISSLQKGIYIVKAEGYNGENTVSKILLK